MKDSTTGTEDDCLRTCYEDTECKYVTYVYDTAANSGLCSLYKKGTTELIAQGGTYELRRDEVLSNCKRKVIMSLSGYFFHIEYLKKIFLKEIGREASLFI
ncbi:hypothetical protein Y032_0019g3746 [Ancylostoma ceylanicum]|uniref:Apple domain-containing protein n=1 Tax=Ancylostoma ceylanicum TaxID=53326 RepID=A0A016V2R1_9BILA|nr:hypothetical protein Y032_0019g3746 [Ancylostoma ceylanicum]